MPERWAGLKDAVTPMQKTPYVVLIAVLVFFGFYPQAMLDTVHDGVKPVFERIHAAQSAEDSAALPAPVRDVPDDQSEER